MPKSRTGKTTNISLKRTIHYNTKGGNLDFYYRPAATLPNAVKGTRGGGEKVNSDPLHLQFKKKSLKKIRGDLSLES